MEDFETKLPTAPTETERVFGEPFELHGKMVQIDQDNIVHELFTLNQDGTAVPPQPIQFPAAESSTEQIKVTIEGRASSIAELLGAAAMHVTPEQQHSRMQPVYADSGEVPLQPQKQTARKRAKPAKRAHIVEPTGPTEIIRMKRPFKFRKRYKRPILAAAAVGIALVSGPVVTSMSSGEAEAQKCMEHGFLNFAANPGCMIGQFTDAMNPKNIFHYGPEDVK